MLQEEDGSMGGKILPTKAAQIINGGWYDAVGNLIMRHGDDLESEKIQIPVKITENRVYH